MNATKRTLAVIALAGAAVMSVTAVANADTRDSKSPQPPQTSTNLVYPYSAAYPPGVLPLAAAPAAAILGFVSPFGVL
ncbi:hypothetical protein [Streptomyces sp. NPDC093591]|uniref:hypothetical protein n=1 Tax=Streptomyces sp. NPDC093591 TaxID=3366044 RepID=UPI003816FDAA